MKKQNFLKVITSFKSLLLTGHDFVNRDNFKKMQKWSLFYVKKTTKVRHRNEENVQVSLILKFAKWKYEMNQIFKKTNGLRLLRVNEQSKCVQKADEIQENTK